MKRIFAMLNQIDILGRNLPITVAITLATALLSLLAPLSSHQDAIVITVCLWGLLSWMIILGEKKQPLTDARHTLSLLIIGMVLFQLVIVLLLTPLLHLILL